MSRRVIGLDAGGTKLLAGVVDEAGSVLHRNVHPWPRGASREDVLRLFREALDEAGDADAIGVGLPATMDIANGVAIGCRHLPIEGFGFRDWLATETGLPVWVDNDATLALLAEAQRGAARHATDAVLLTIGTGIGGGIMSGGRLVRGDRGAAGEPGHMTIEADGPPCPGNCPNRGCLEAFVSGPALARMGWPTAADAIAAARGGDEDARVALEQMGEKLGVGLASLMNLLDPEVIVIGGGAMAAGELLLGPAREELRRRALPPGRDLVRIVEAKFGPDAGMLGGAVLAFDGLDG